MEPVDKSERGLDMSKEVGPGLARETAVRVLLFNSRDQVLLQEVNVPGKPAFYITPGGRLDGESEELVQAVIREIREETGFERFEVQSESPVFTGKHVMEKKSGPVAMTEHFFVAHLKEESDQIDDTKQALTEEEREVFRGQRWVSLGELREGAAIVVPINLADCVEAVLKGDPFPAVDFSDPPEFT